MGGENYRLEPILGRYLNVDIAGKKNRIYFEESTLSDDGAIPIICLHTAGSNNTQFRHLLVDEEVAKKFKIIAFDMPWHGKSLPPVGYQNEEYKLTTELYVETVNTFIAAIGVTEPVIMGCSMGGRIVLELARRCGKYLKAVLGLEALVLSLHKALTKHDGRHFGDTWRRDQEYLRGICTSIGRIVTLGAARLKLIQRYAHYICLRVNMIFLAHLKILSGQGGVFLALKSK